MRIGVVVGRRSHVKLLGSVIDEAVRRGHEVTLYVGLWPSPEAALRAEDLPVGWQGRLPWATAWPVSSEGWTWVGHDLELERWPRGGRRVGVPYFFSDLIRRPVERREATVCYLSAYHQNRHGRLYGSDWPHAHPVCGWPGGDHGRVVGSPEQVRARYRLTASAPVVIFTPKRRTNERGWRRLMRQWQYGQWLRWAIGQSPPGRVFKVREKNRDARWLGRWGPVIGDVSLYPATAMELLSVAGRAMLGSTGAQYEAAWLKVPTRVRPTSISHVLHQPGVAQTYADLARCGVEEMLGPRSQHAAANILDVIEQP